MKAGWVPRPIGELCDIVGGGTPSKSNAAFFNGTIPWATVRDMKTDWIETTEHSISAEAVKNSSTNVLPSGAVVVASRVGLGKVCRVTRDTAINQDLRGFIPKANAQLDIQYLFWWFKSVSAKIVAAGNGATVQGVTLPFLRSLEIPLPPLDEQRRIVAVLDKAFAGVAIATANVQTNLSNARALFESYANGAFEEVALTAVRPLLETLTVAKSGITYGVVKPGDTGSIPFVRGGDLIGGKVRLDRLRTITSQVSEQYSRTLLRGGELLMCLVGVPGQCAITPAELAGANIARQVGLIRLRSDVNAEYVKDYLQSPPGQKSLGTFTGGSVQQVINLGDLRQVEIPLPERSTQDQMVKRLATVKQLSDDVAQKHRAKLAALTELKQSLLQKAFAGELS